MRLRKTKTTAPSPPSTQRRRTAPNASSPAFSYYANRTPEPVRDRGQQQVDKRTAGSTPKRPSATRLAANSISFWILIAVAVICVIKVLFLSTNPKIVVVGKNAVTADYVQSVSVYEDASRKLMDSSVTNRSKVTVDLAGMSQKLRTKYPELQDVSMSVPLIGNRPIVYIQIASPSLILQTPSGNFALSSSGVVLARLKAIPGGVPLISDQSGAVPQIGRHYLPGSTVAFARTVAYQLAAAHINLNTFVLPSGSPYELDVRLEGQAYVVRCNLATDPLLQSGAMVATIQQLGSAVPSTYLDVRVPDRVYYK